jgi:alkyl hydroperoxide reductase subunit F
MNVKIYATGSCGYCKMEKEYLDTKGVSYQEIRVDRDSDAAQEMVDISGQIGVPFTIIELENGEKHHILGFNQEKLNKILDF